MLVQENRPGGYYLNGNVPPEPSEKPGLAEKGDSEKKISKASDEQSSKLLVKLKFRNREDNEIVVCRSCKERMREFFGTEAEYKALKKMDDLTVTAPQIPVENFTAG